MNAKIHFNIVKIIYPQFFSVLMELKTKQNNKIGFIIGYIIMYLIFTTILYFILKIFDKIPKTWNLFFIIPITLSIVLLGTLLKLILTK